MADPQLDAMLNEMRNQTRLLQTLSRGTSGAGGGGGGGGGVGAAGGFNPGIMAAKLFGQGLTQVAKLVGASFGALEDTAKKGAQALFSMAAAAVDGKASLTDLANAMTGMIPGPLKMFGQALTLAASVMEHNVKVHQELSKAGANFSGDLNTMRIAAGKTQMGMDEFAGAIVKNKAIFSSMGGTAQDGVNRFVSIQSALLAPGSSTSKNLSSLGYSAAEAADLTASYMRSQGNMNKAELQDSQKVAKSVATYAKELDELSDITGKTREEARKALDEQNSEAQWANFLASVDPKEAEKMKQNMQNAFKQGGKPAMDAYKAMAQGLPVQTKEGQLYVATQKAGRESLERLNKNAKDAGVSVEENAKINRKELAKVIASGDMDKMRNVLRASAGAGGDMAKVLSDATVMQNKYMKDGKRMSEEEILADLEKVSKSKEIGASQASAAVDTQRAFQELANQLLQKLMPVLNLFLKWAEQGAFWLASFVDPLIKLVGGSGGPLDKLVELFNVLDDSFSTEGGLTDFILTTWSQFTDMILDVFDIVVDVTKMFLQSDAFRSIKSVFKKMMEILGELVAVVRAIIDSPVGKTVIQVIFTVFSFLFDLLGDVIDALTGVVRIVKGIFKFISGDFGGGLSDIATGLMNIIESLVTFFLVRPIQLIVGLATDLLPTKWKNALLDLYNAIIDTIKDMAKNAIKWGKDVASGAVSAVGDTAKKGLSYIGLAEGGIVTSPTTANIAEKGRPEAVIPLDKLQSVLQQSANAGKMGLPPMTQGAMSYSASGVSDSLLTEIKQLNTNMAMMLKYTMMQAQYSESNVRATKSLSRDLFKF